MINLFQALIILTGVLAKPLTADEFGAQVQEIIDSYASFLNVAYSVGITHETYNNTFVAGVNDHATGKNLTATDLIPLGSMIKPMTAMSVLRLIEQGKVGFNDSIGMHVDPILKSGNGTTMLELWNNNTEINNVTIYQLLHMKGGLKDYNDGQMRQWTLDHPNEDFSPFDYLHTLDKTF